MIAVDLHMQCNLHHRQDLLRVAEENRRARQARHPRPLRPRVGHALIAAGQMLIGQPAYAAHDEALAIVNRCEREYRQAPHRASTRQPLAVIDVGAYDIGAGRPRCPQGPDVDAEARDGRRGAPTHQ